MRCWFCLIYESWTGLVVWLRQPFYSVKAGIYVGEGKVIHFTQSRGEGQAIGKGTLLNRIIVSSSPSNPLDIPCPICGDQSKLDGVISSCIDCFLLGGVMGNKHHNGKNTSAE